MRSRCRGRRRSMRNSSPRRKSRRFRRTRRRRACCTNRSSRHACRCGRHHGRGRVDPDRLGRHGGVASEARREHVRVAPSVRAGDLDRRLTACGRDDRRIRVAHRSSARRRSCRSCSPDTSRSFRRCRRSSRPRRAAVSSSSTACAEVAGGRSNTPETPARAANRTPRARRSRRSETRALRHTEGRLAALPMAPPRADLP